MTFSCTVAPRNDDEKYNDAPRNDEEKYNIGEFMLVDISEFVPVGVMAKSCFLEYGGQFSALCFFCPTPVLRFIVPSCVS